MQEQIWSTDYLHSLQNRNKWSEPQDVMVNNLVIVRNSLLPPSEWELARIVEVHPGSNEHIRVVTVRSSQYKRPIAQICKLPVQSGHDALEHKNT